MEWISTMNGIITLITGLCGLAGTAVATYFAIKNFINVMKTKNKNEVWTLIMTIADAAMTEAEESGKCGEDKKKMVIDSVKAGCNAAGLNIDDFIDQLSAYIDDTIKFVNDMNKKNQ